MSDFDDEFERQLDEGLNEEEVDYDQDLEEDQAPDDEEKGEEPDLAPNEDYFSEGEEEEEVVVEKKGKKKESKSVLVFEGHPEGKIKKQKGVTWVATLGENVSGDRELFCTLVRNKVLFAFSEFKKRFTDYGVKKLPKSSDNTKALFISKMKSVLKSVSAETRSAYETLRDRLLVEKKKGESSSITDTRRYETLSQQLSNNEKLTSLIESHKIDEKDVGVVEKFVMVKEIQDLGVLNSLVPATLKAKTLYEAKKIVSDTFSKFVNKLFPQKHTKLELENMTHEELQNLSQKKGTKEELIQQILESQNVKVWKHSKFEDEDWITEKSFVYPKYALSKEMKKTKTLGAEIENLKAKVGEIKSGASFQNADSLTQALMLVFGVGKVSLLGLRLEMKKLLEVRFEGKLGKPRMSSKLSNEKEEIDEKSKKQVEKLKEGLKSHDGQSFVNGLVSKYGFETVSKMKLADAKKELSSVVKKAKQLVVEEKKELNVETILDGMQERYGDTIFDQTSDQLAYAIKSNTSSTILERLIASKLSSLVLKAKGKDLAEILMKVIYDYIKSQTLKYKDYIFSLAKEVELDVTAKKKRASSPKKSSYRSILVRDQVNDFEERTFSSSLSSKRTNSYDISTGNKYLDVNSYLIALSQPLIFTSLELSKLVTKESKVFPYAKVYNKKLASGNYVLTDFVNQIDYFPELAVGVNSLSKEEWERAQNQLIKIQTFEVLKLVKGFVTAHSPIHKYLPETQGVSTFDWSKYFPEPQRVPTFDWSEYLAKFPGLCYGKNAADIIICKGEDSEFYCDSTKRIIDEFKNNKGVDSRTGKRFCPKLIAKLKERYPDPSDYVMPPEEKEEEKEKVIAIEPEPETVTGRFIPIYEALLSDFVNPINPVTNSPMSKKARESFSKLYPILYGELKKKKRTIPTQKLPEKLSSMQDIARVALMKSGVVIMMYNALLKSDAPKIWETIPRNDKIAYFVVKLNEQVGKKLSTEFQTGKKPHLILLTGSKSSPKDAEDVVKVKMTQGGYVEVGTGEVTKGEKQNVYLNVLLKSGEVGKWGNVLEEKLRGVLKKRAAPKPKDEGLFGKLVQTIVSGNTTGQENVIDVQSILQDEPKLVNKRVKRTMIPTIRRKGFITKTTPLLLALKRELRVVEKPTLKKGVDENKLLETFKRLANPTKEEETKFKKAKVLEKLGILAKIAVSNYNHNYMDLVQTLLDAGANPNASGVDKITPLAYVVKFVYVTQELRDLQLDLVKRLMAVGANPNLGEESAIEVAKKVGNKFLVEYMKNTKPGKRIIVRKVEDEREDESGEEVGDESEGDEGSEESGDESGEEGSEEVGDESGEEGSEDEE